MAHQHVAHPFGLIGGEPLGAGREVADPPQRARRHRGRVEDGEVRRSAGADDPAVAEAAVFPARSELAEDEVMAAIVARDGAAVDPAALCAWCAERLPKFAIPRYLDVVADLPRTGNGKVQKFVLRERGVGAGTWDREVANALARRVAFD